MVNDLDFFFEGRGASRPIFDALAVMVHSIGPVRQRVTKSQIAFRRCIAFAWAWIPGQYLHGKTVPLVLSVALRRRDASPRWKEIAEPYPGRFMHHLELNGVDDLDDQVRQWLEEAWCSAK